MVDPISVAGGVTKVLSICGKLLEAILTKITAHDVVQSLRQDLDELEQQVTYVQTQFKTAEEARIAIEPVILERVEKVHRDCSNTLEKLRIILEKSCGTMDGPLTRIKEEIMNRFQQEDVRHIRNRIATFQQTLQFYLILIVRWFPFTLFANQR
jgi:predicted secreted Zn-dependent protease